LISIFMFPKKRLEIFLSLTAKIQSGERIQNLAKKDKTEDF